MVTASDTIKSDAGDEDGEIGFIDTGAIAAGPNWFLCYPDNGPWSTLAIYRNRLVLKGPFRSIRYDLARSEVARVVVEGWLSSHIRIHHTRHDYPPYITFSPLNLDLVVDGLRRVGYLVECK
jgi:hypothetical protein